MAAACRAEGGDTTYNQMNQEGQITITPIRIKSSISESFDIWDVWNSQKISSRIEFWGISISSEKDWIIQEIKQDLWRESRIWRIWKLWKRSLSHQHVIPFEIGENFEVCGTWTYIVYCTYYSRPHTAVIATYCLFRKIWIFLKVSLDWKSIGGENKHAGKSKFR